MNNKEKFSIVPTRFTDFKHTTVSPIFAEEWSVRPPSYDLFTNIPIQENKEINKIEDPRDYPYGQYLTNINLLPRDEYKVNRYLKGVRTPIGYVNNLFTYHDISFRENMSRILKKKLARRFRHECNDVFSPYYSF